MKQSPPLPPLTSRRRGEKLKGAEGSAATVQKSRQWEPPFPAEKLWRIGSQSRADRPQLRPRGAGEDGSQLPPPFNLSSFSCSEQEHREPATDGGAAHRRHRVPAGEPSAPQLLLTRP